ncbi:MAG: SGNH/GDSL hydrolase family protein [Acidimicrobiales bacterium]
MNFGPRRVLAASGGLVALLAVTVGLSACQPPPDTYVALGDSYTSGPLIPNQSLNPLGCLRSDKNYPHLVRPQINVTKFVDVSCSGAQTKDFFAPQNVTPGPANPPQLDAVTEAAKVVTVGIGGNDIGFTDIVKNCGSQNPFGSGCKPDYVHDGRDELRERIDAAAPNVDRALAGVKQKGPQAKVFLIGYPTIIPETGNGCYPLVPILGSDTVYLRGVAKYLNSMLAARAAAANVTYVDTAASSVGHDYCSLSKWVEGIIPTSVAAPVHPNAAGMRNTTTDVAKAINALVTS